MKKVIKNVDLSNIDMKGNSRDWKNSQGKLIPFEYGDINGVLQIIDYFERKVLVEYNENKKWIFVGHLTDAKIGELIGLNTVKFKYEIGQRIINKEKDIDITIINRKYEKRKHGHSYVNEKLYQYKCNKCGYDCREYYKRGIYHDSFWIIETDLLNGHGCTLCCTPPQIVVSGINDIPTTDPWMIPYFQGGYDEAKKYCRATNKKLYFKCPDCGKIRNKLIGINTLYSSRSISCVCQDGISYPEKFISSMLDELNIKYISQLNKSNFKWCQNYRYDFYLLEYNYIIEVHGLQHYEDSFSNLSKVTLEEQQLIDAEKESLALNNNISEYIILDCRYSTMNYIMSSVLSSKFNLLFDLSKIDFKKCAAFANSNVCKEICEYYNNHQYELKKDIAEKFHISVPTLNTYLKKGNDASWCVYSSNSHQSKKVYVYSKNLKYLRTYNNVYQLSDNSINDFGIFLSKTQIYNVCRKKIESYKGYIFSYTQLHNELETQQEEQAI